MAITCHQYRTLLEKRVRKWLVEIKDERGLPDYDFPDELSDYQIKIIDIASRLQAHIEFQQLLRSLFNRSKNKKSSFLKLIGESKDE